MRLGDTATCPAAKKSAKCEDLSRRLYDRAPMGMTRPATVLLIVVGILVAASPAAADRVYFSSSKGISYADLDAGMDTFQFPAQIDLEYA